MGGGGGTERCKQVGYVFVLYSFYLAVSSRFLWVFWVHDVVILQTGMCFVAMAVRSLRARGESSGQAMEEAGLTEGDWVEARGGGRVVVLRKGNKGWRQISRGWEGGREGGLRLP